MRFRRPKGLLPLPTPRRGGSITALRPFVNAPDDDMFMLIVARPLPSCAAEDRIRSWRSLANRGPRNRTTAKVIKMLVDPSTAPLRSEPREPRDLMIAAENNHILAFDNISTIKPWLSDCLCRLATGGGFSTRTLYENREEEIFDAVRPVILNGIPEFVDAAGPGEPIDLPISATDSRSEATGRAAVLGSLRTGAPGPPGGALRHHGDGAAARGDDRDAE